MNIDAILKNVSDILVHYPPEKHDLLRKQLANIVDLINEEKNSYMNDPKISKILNKVLSDIIEGKYLN